MQGEEGLISIAKPTRCTFFRVFFNITLHFSDGPSIHYQEFKTVHTASGICHIGSLTSSGHEMELHLVPASMQSTNLYDIHLMLYVLSWSPDDGRRDRPKHVE